MFWGNGSLEGDSSVVSEEGYVVSKNVAAVDHNQLFHDENLLLREI